MDEDELKALEQKAHELHTSLKTDFPELEREMNAVTELVYYAAGAFPLREVIYKSLMTGAALLHEKYNNAGNTTEELLSVLLKK